MGETSPSIGSLLTDCPPPECERLGDECPSEDTIPKVILPDNTGKASEFLVDN